MDVTNPELLWQGPRCYRINIPNKDRIQSTVRDFNYEDQEDEFDNEECMKTFAKELDIKEIDGGRKFQLNMHVPQMFHSHIIGVKGSTKKRIEQEHNVQIVVPKMYSKDTNVLITGTTKRDISETQRRIEELVIAGRSKKEITHFVSIPCNNSEVKANFIKFREDILHDYHGGLDQSLFQNPDKLHLTVVVMVLLDDIDRNRASDLLLECKNDIVDPILQGSPLKVEVSGIEIMNDDPSSVHVLYANVISEKLQEIVNQIAKLFSNQGLNNSKFEREDVKLHLTLINSSFRFAESQESSDRNEMENSQTKRKYEKKRSFDAREILERFKNFHFGSFIINEIHLSRRKCYDESGFYKSSAVIKL